MSGCTDRRIGDMLYAYELGLLNESERAEVEAHLIECTHCFRRASKFERSAQLMRHDPIVREAVLTSSFDSASSEGAEVKPGKRGLTGVLFSGRMIPSYAMAAVLLLFLLIQPWGVRFSSTDEAYAVEDRLAVVNFGAADDDRDRLSQITTHLLITDLSETRQVKVVSSERLFDVLHSLGLEGGAEVTPDIASEVARETRARWVLTGTVLQVEPTIVIEGKVINALTDSVIVSQRAEGREGDDIFSVVDLLSAKITRSLTPANSPRSNDARPVREMTTGSTEAYRHYLEGREAMFKVYTEDAVRSFRRAIELDSTFAMAYYNLAVLSTGEERTQMIGQAERHSSHATRKDRYYIRCRLAQWSGDIDAAITELESLLADYGNEKDALQLAGQLEFDFGRFGRAIVRFSEVLEVDSQQAGAYNMLAYAYRAIGDPKAANEALDRYIELAPDEANPHDTRACFFWRDGQTDLALEAFDKAIDLKPDFYPSHKGIARILMDRKAFDKAAEHLVVLADSDDPSTRIDGLLGPVHMLVIQGKLRAALDELNRVQIGDRSIIAGSDSVYISAAVHYLRAQILAELDDCEAARLSLGMCLDRIVTCESTYRLTPEQACASLMAVCEGIDIESIEREPSKVGVFDSSGAAYWTVRGAIALAGGNSSTAVSLLEQANEHAGYHSPLLLGRAYLEAGRFDRAIANLRAVVDYYRYEWSSISGVSQVKSHYYLGLAYENSNWTDRAIGQYEQFLDFWGGSDVQLPIVTDARRRLARLKAGA